MFDLTWTGFIWNLGSEGNIQNDKRIRNMTQEKRLRELDIFSFPRET